MLGSYGKGSDLVQTLRKEQKHLVPFFYSLQGWLWRRKRGRRKRDDEEKTGGENGRRKRDGFNRINWTCPVIRSN